MELQIERPRLTFREVFRRWWWLGVLCVPVFMLIGSSVFDAIKPYESTALVHIKPYYYISDFELHGTEFRENESETPPYFLNECEIIRSRDILIRVVEKLGLEKAWGMDREATLNLLQKSVVAFSVRGTDELRIIVSHPNKVDACNIATEVARSYRDYHQEIGIKRMERGLEELSKAVREQQERLEDSRKAFNIIDIWTKAKPVPEDGKQPAVDKADYLNAKRKMVEAEEMLQAMETKLMSEKITSRIPRQPVVIQQEGALSDDPFDPDTRLHLLLGVGIGGVIGLLLVVPLMFLAERMFPREAAQYFK